MMVSIQNNKLIREYDGEKMLIEAFGENSVRIRVTKLNEFDNENWALIEQEEIIPTIEVSKNSDTSDGVVANAEVVTISDGATLINGKISIQQPSTP